MVKNGVNYGKKQGVKNMKKPMDFYPKIDRIPCALKDEDFEENFNPEHQQLERYYEETQNEQTQK